MEAEQGKRDQTRLERWAESREFSESYVNFGFYPKSNGNLIKGFT